MVIITVSSRLEKTPLSSKYATSGSISSNRNTAFSAIGQQIFFRLGMIRNSLSSLVGGQIFYALSDKSYDVRASACSEIESLSRKALTLKDDEFQQWCSNIVEGVEAELLNRANANGRKGGLSCLASMCIALRAGISEPIATAIIRCVTNAINDDDSHVRYMACESLFNIIGSLPKTVLADYFPILFDSLCKILHDVDIHSTCAALDRLLRESFIFDSTPIQVYEIVESRLLYPQPVVKQLSLGWLTSLYEKDTQTVISRIALIMPPLFSLLSTQKGDIIVAADSLLSRIVRDIDSQEVELEDDSRKQLLSVLFKYAKFQDSMKIRPRIFMFEFFRLLTNGENVIDPNAALGIVSTLIGTNASGEKDLSAFVNRFSESLLGRESFLNHIVIINDYPKILVDSASTVESVEPLIRWLDRLLTVQSIRLEPNPKISPQSLLTLPGIATGTGDQLEGILRILQSQYELKDYAHEVLVLLRKTSGGVELFCQCYSRVMGDECVIEILVAVVNALGGKSTDMSLGIDGDVVMALIRILCGNEKLFGKIVDVVHGKQFLETTRTVCIVGFLLLCIITEHYEEGVEGIASFKLLPEEHGNIFAKIFDSEPFVKYRTALLRAEGRLLGRLLLEISIRMNQESDGFKILLGRLQVLSIHKSLVVEM